MVTLSDGVVTLRDFIEADIADYVRWETVETEWKLWDAPWEHEGHTEEQRAVALEEDIAWMRSYAREMAAFPDDAPRRRFEVCVEGGDVTAPEHIGGVSTYRIDDGYSIAEDGAHLALGIDINSMAARGKGYAERALHLFIRYLFDQGERALYCQTWSGNVRMIGLARKLGFVECCRKKGIREVRGERFDGLTFVLEDPKAH